MNRSEDSSFVYVVDETLTPPQVLSKIHFESHHMSCVMSSPYLETAQFGSSSMHSPHVLQANSCKISKFGSYCCGTLANYLYHRCAAYQYSQRCIHKYMRSHHAAYSNLFPLRNDGIGQMVANSGTSSRAHSHQHQLAQGVDRMNGASADTINTNGEHRGWRIHDSSHGMLLFFDEAPLITNRIY